MSCSVVCVFFFFQAEDGIRDLIVTGVQTCALPICAVFCSGCGRPSCECDGRCRRRLDPPRFCHACGRRLAVQVTPASYRSEEHTSELQSRSDLVCRLLLEKKKKNHTTQTSPGLAGG